MQVLRDLFALLGRRFQGDPVQQFHVLNHGKGVRRDIGKEQHVGLAEFVMPETA
jgi:hypothetical protein